MQQTLLCLPTVGILDDDGIALVVGRNNIYFPMPHSARRVAGVVNLKFHTTDLPPSTATMTASENI